MTLVAYIFALLSLACDVVNPYVGVFGALFKAILLFVIGMALINAHVRLKALSDTSPGNYYQSLEARGLMRERTGRGISDGVLKGMVVMIRVVAVLLVAVSTVLNGLLYVLVVTYPKEISLAPFVSVGKTAGLVLLAVGFVLSVASAVCFWKVATRMRRIV